MQGTDFKWMYHWVLREPCLCPTEVFVTSCRPLLLGLTVYLLAWPFACLACRLACLACLSKCMILYSASLLYRLHLVEFLVASLTLQYLACLHACLLMCLDSRLSVIGLYLSRLSLPFRPQNFLVCYSLYLLAAISFLIPTSLFIFTCCASLPPSLRPLADRLGRPTAVIRYVCVWLKSTEERTYWLTDLKKTWQCFVLCVPLLYTDKPCETN